MIPVAPGAEAALVAAAPGVEPETASVVEASALALEGVCGVPRDPVGGAQAEGCQAVFQRA
eukprot:10566906-Lingulodinium_polyedra.AAC.1